MSEAEARNTSVDNEGSGASWRKLNNSGYEASPEWMSNRGMESVVGGHYHISRGAAGGGAKESSFS